MSLSSGQPYNSAEGDRQSRAVGGQPGPNKGNVNGQAPSGAAAFGTELGAEGDAVRERADAIRNGEKLPDQRQNVPDGPAFGQYNGLEQGVQQFSSGERNDMQNERNQTNQSDQPDLASIARTSGGSGSFNPKMNQSEFVSTGASNPSQVLGTASSSTGTDTGTGASGLGGQGSGGPGGDNVSGSAPGASFK